MRGCDKCRSHLDRELGPRGAGAPRGNLNAFKTGDYINPIGPVQLQRLADQIARDPASYRDVIMGHIDDLYLRIGYRSSATRVFGTLIALNKTVEELIPCLANALFIQELENMAQRCPPENRAAYIHDIWSLLAPYSPEQRLLALVRAGRDREPIEAAGKKADDQADSIQAAGED